MELNSILSLIILIETIAIIIFAVSVHKLYKMAERYEKSHWELETEELYSPATIGQKSQISDTDESREQPLLIEDELIMKTPEPILGDETHSESSIKKEKYQRHHPNSKTVLKKRDSRQVDKKFMRYRREGIIEPIKDEKKNGETLRWR